MTTYPTIEEAFKNGSGDTFFQKEGGFVAFSRKDESIHDSLKAQGFRFLPWHLAFEIGKAQIEKSESAVVTENVVVADIKITKSYDQILNGRDGYYDEFPDAYGQYL